MHVFVLKLNFFLFFFLFLFGNVTKEGFRTKKKEQRSGEIHEARGEGLSTFGIMSKITFVTLDNCHLQCCELDAR